MADILSKGSLFPEELIPGFIQKTTGASALAKLCGATPIAFNGQKEFTFTLDKEVDIVAENGAKGKGGMTVEPITIVPIKIEYGARVSDEFLYASEDAQMDVLSAFADGFAVWLLLRCLWGIAWTLLRLGGFYCILNVSSDDNRGYFMGLYNGLYRIGSLAGMLLGGIFADWLGFSVTCMLFGACTAATIVLGFLCVPRGNSGVPAGTQAEERSLTWLWKDGTVLWVMATGLVVALIYQGLYASTLSELIRIHFGSSVTLLGGVAVGAATLGGVLQAIRWGWEPWLAPGIGVLSDRRFGRRSMMVVSLAFGVVVFGLVALRLPLPLWLAVLIGIQLTGTSLTTIADSVASDTASVRGGRVFMMWYSFAVDLGAALGPILAYLLNDMWGMDTAYAGTAVLLLILAVKWYWSAPLLKPFVRRFA